MWQIESGDEMLIDKVVKYRILGNKKGRKIIKNILMKKNSNEKTPLY